MISRHFSSATDQSGDIVVAPINYDGNDEIADVVLSFNKMAEDVERTTTSVDKLNKKLQSASRQMRHCRPAKEN